MSRAPMPKERKIFVTIVIAIVTVILVAGGIFAYNVLQRENEFMGDHTGIFSGRPKGYDFEKLKKVYPDCVAWLDVPNTNIAMPIVQDPSNDFYYLNHNAQKNYDVSGAAYLQNCNKADMSDPVTVCYGHNMIDNGMFSTAHYFENTQFFNDNDNFYVYTPGHKLTYTIVSAYVGDNRHIINTNSQFKDKAVIDKYHSDIQNPTTMRKNVRPGINLTTDDKIFVLSTCMSEPAFSDQRYLVCGYLTKDELTA